jgi:hypothetical protein
VSTSTWFRRLAEWAPRLLEPDVIRDAHVYGGLVLVGVGLWQLSRPWALIALGVALLVLGLVVPSLRRRTP